MKVCLFLDFYGPESARAYFEMIDAFLVNCLGVSVGVLQIILGDAESVAIAVQKGCEVFASSASKG